MPRWIRAALLLAVVLLDVLVFAHAGPLAAQEITLATSTSVRDTGLLDELLPRFKLETGIDVKVAAVGSGAAFELGRQKQAHVIIAHSPAEELAFLGSGSASSLQKLMANSYLIVGPQSDPAGLKKATSAPDALKRVASQGAPWVSRSDESGTHALEKQLWKQAGADPTGKPWSIAASTGMGAALKLADQKQAYLLIDRGTWLALKRETRLVALHQGGPELANPYSVMLVRVRGDQALQGRAADKLVTFLRSEPVQERIGTFGKDRFGEPLFHPYTATAAQACPAVR